MKYEKVTERCRLWARLQLVAFLGGVVGGFATQSPWVAWPPLLVAVILNVPVLKNAKCPECGNSLISNSASPGRLLPIFRLIGGSQELCAVCGAQKTERISEQRN